MEDFGRNNAISEQKYSADETQDIEKALLMIKLLEDENSRLSQANTRLMKKNDELVQDQSIDPKTGVLTEQFFNNFHVERLQLKLRQFNQACPEEKKQLEKHLLFLLDMNGLKRINDEEGYAAGDLAIVNVAESLKKVVRADDLLIRMNTAGDEFILITTLKPDADVEEAEIMIAERINNLISENSQNRFSVSFGSALLEDHISLIKTREKAETDLKQQKAKLYKSKFKRVGSKILQIIS